MRILGLLFGCFLSINAFANSSVADKGIGYQSPIKVNNKVTYDYIYKLLVVEQSKNYLAVMEAIKTTGNSSYETLKSACYLEGSSNSTLEFMTLNKNYIDSSISKFLFNNSNSTLSTAQKITLGRCTEVLAIIKNQEAVNSKIRQQELMNKLMNIK